MSTITAEIAGLREQVAALHSELVRYGLGEPLPIPPSDQDRLYERYQNAYGQR